MVFTETRLQGALVVDIESREDDRGMFARTFCRDEFGRHGLPAGFAQCNTSFNRHRGTLRGMHFQAAPKAEGKLVRCTRGSIYDVIIDLRPGSPTFRQWVSVFLSQDNRRAVYAPPGFAHGFQTLEPDAEVFYQMTESYVPELARGVRWNDPAFGIEWPLSPPTLSDRDAGFPDFAP
ncbi:MAG: dTDP-4-dehydrorhamnose 3,5-epimerase [Betaproteobacteria bacterium]|nr:dTDP-4-dehydrorhamnose 3,5-epimerase [Betaproteobacteria bacterium]